MAERGSTASPGRGASVVSLVSRRRDRPPPPASSARSPRTSLTVIAVAQAALFGLSPLFAGFYGFSTWGLLSLATFAILTALLFVSPVRLGGTARWALSGLLLLAVWSALSLLWAPSKDAAWTEVNRVGFYLVTFVVGVAVIRTRRVAWMVVGTLCVSATVVVAYVLIHLLAGTGQQLFIEYRLHGPLGYVNGQAAFMLLAFWPFVAVAERARPPVLAGAGALMAVATLGLVALTQSRAIAPALFISTLAILGCAPGRLRRAWLLLLIAGCAGAALPSVLDVYASRVGTSPNGGPTDTVLRDAALWVLLAAGFAGIAWGVVTAILPRIHAPRLRIPAAVLAVFIAASAVVLLLTQIDHLGPRLKSEYHDFVELRVNPNTTQRFTSGGGFRYDLWRIAIRQFESSPLEGVGAGNYVSTFFLERHQPQSVRQPHSIELQVLGELGVVGLAALLVFLTGVLSVLVRQRAKTIGRQDPGLVVACGGVFVAWLVDGSVDWVYNLPGITGMALVCGSVLTAENDGNWRDDGSPRAGLDVFLRAAGIAVLALLAASVGRQFAADWYTEKSQASLASNPEKSYREAAQALSLNASRMDAYYLQAAALARRNDYDGARSKLLAASRREPFNYVPWALLGDLATRRGDRSQATIYYRQASRRNPYDVGLKDLATGKGGQAR